MLNITGLWENTSKAGETYYSGNLGNVKILVYKNNKKEPGSKQPDWNLCIAEKEKKADNTNARTTDNTQVRTSVQNDEVPF